MRLQTTIVLSVLSAVFAGCQRSESRYLSRSVSPSEVVGTWAATPAAIDGLSFAGHKKHLSFSDHVIVIRPDATCSYFGFRDPDVLKYVEFVKQR